MISLGRSVCLVWFDNIAFYTSILYKKKKKTNFTPFNILNMIIYLILKLLMPNDLTSVWLMMSSFMITIKPTLREVEVQN